MIGLLWEFTSCSMTVSTAILDADVISRVFVSGSLPMYDSCGNLSSSGLATLNASKASSSKVMLLF